MPQNAVGLSRRMLESSASEIGGLDYRDIFVEAPKVPAGSPPRQFRVLLMVFLANACDMGHA